MRQAQKVPAPPVTVVAPVPAARPGAPAPAKAPVQASQASSKASALIATLKGRSLPEADRSLSEARKVPGIRLDLNALAGRIAAARQALGGAEKDLAAKEYDQALQEATSIQGQIADIVNQLSAATSSSKQRR
jgi:cell division septum initiation protein DivIVA